MADDLARVLEDLFRREWPVLVGAAARITGDLGRGEELAQDVLVTALDRWPFTGVPERPAAWLATAVRNRARNWLRDEARRRARDRAAARPELVEPPELDDATPIEDDQLRLVFLCCHPLLGEEARVALTLRMVGGLSTAEIARAFLVPLPTMAQRLVRAKRLLAEARVPFDLPDAEQRGQRLPGVLAVLYLIFNEGYSAAAGDQLTRPQLCVEALRLAALLAELVPAEPKVHGLLALLSLHSARLPGRVDDGGDLVLLQLQDRTRWDRALVARGEAEIERALALSGGAPGPLTLEAMIAACHTRARSWADTDWAAIAALYGRLHQANPSPVVALNRAVATSMLDPEAAWPELEALTEQLSAYPPLWATRADLLRRLGRHTEAAREYRRAAGLGMNDVERRYLLTRADECDGAAQQGRTG
jgi:RNA polymerase sigma-70 factor, ECF subfamily